MNLSMCFLTIFCLFLSFFNASNCFIASLSTALYIGGASLIGYLAKDKIIDVIDSRIELCFRVAKNPNYQHLPRKIFGQHIALEIVPKLFQVHFSKDEPRAALFVAFHGKTGVGKNHLAELLINEIYPHYKSHGAGQSKFVTLFNGKHMFGDMIVHKNRIIQTINEKLAACPRSAFIFDEIDDLPVGFLNFLASYATNKNMNGIENNKAIFIFLTNGGQKFITAQYLKLLQEGRTRSSMTFEDFEQTVRKASDQYKGAFQNSELITRHVIQFHVPFLPLEKQHIKECIISSMKKFNVSNPEVSHPALIENLLLKHIFTDQLSDSGCRGIEEKVEAFLPSK